MNPQITEALLRFGFSPGEAFILAGVCVQISLVLVRVRKVETLALDNAARLDELAPRRATVAAAR